MSAAHTPGRLKTFGMYAHPEIHDQDDNCVAAVGNGLPRSVSNARRLVACWNACQGLPTDALEKNPASLSQLLTQRDELLIALEHALAWNDDAQPEPAWVSEARAVIAKATGSAA